MKNNRRVILFPALILFVSFISICLTPNPCHGKTAPTAESTAHSSEGEHGHGEINWFRFGEKNPPLIANFINLAIMLFILWYFAKKPVTNYFRERSRKVKSAIEDAQNLKDETDEKYRLISDKLDNIEKEMQTMKKELIASAVIENERVIAEARSHTDLIRSNTLRLIEQEKEAMIEDLKREIADKVIERAQQIAKEKITKTDHDRLTMETIDHYAKIM